MSDKYKPVYVRGTKSGTGVIEALVPFGGKNDKNFSGTDRDSIYYISPEDNIIHLASEYSDFGKYIIATAKEIKPVKWRAKEGGIYYMISASLFVLETTDDRDSIDHDVYNSGNYFKTREEAEKVLKKIKPYFHDSI